MQMETSVFENMGSSSWDDYYYIGEEELPPGYRFRPSDEELLVVYLKRKLANLPLPCNSIIVETDVYAASPRNLTASYRDSGGSQEWFFFSSRKKKYLNGKRPDRAAGGGIWKAIANAKKIYFQGNHIGNKRTLVYQVKPSPKFSEWNMHEYTLNQPPRAKGAAEDMKLDDMVLCKIYKKTTKKSSDESSTRGMEENVQQEFQDPSPMSALENSNDSASAAPQRTCEQKGFDNMVLCESPQQAPNNAAFVNYNSDPSSDYESVQTGFEDMALWCELPQQAPNNAVFANYNSDPSSDYESVAPPTCEQTGFEDMALWCELPQQARNNAVFVNYNNEQTGFEDMALCELPQQAPNAAFVNYNSDSSTDNESVAMMMMMPPHPVQNFNLQGANFYQEGAMPTMSMMPSPHPPPVQNFNQGANFYQEGAMPMMSRMPLSATTDPSLSNCGSGNANAVSIPQWLAEFDWSRLDEIERKLGL